jgi:hypothetical protein
MKKVNVSVNVRGEVVTEMVTYPENAEDCCKLLREEELTRLCQNYVKRMVTGDLRKRAEYIRLMKAYDKADDTTQRGMFSTALASESARKTLLRSIE